MQISENQNQAAGDIVDLIVHATGRNGGVHPATAIAGAARLSGSFLLRSFKFEVGDAKPGTVLLSQEANEEGPLLINVIGAVLSSLGVQIDNSQMESAEPQTSNLDFLTSMEATQSEAIKIMEKHGLEAKEMSVSCAMATAFIIQQCRQDLPAEAGFQTAIMGLIEGSKTAPPKMTYTEKKKKRFGLW